MNEQNPTFPTGVPGLFASRPIRRPEDEDPLLTAAQQANIGGGFVQGTGIADILGLYPEFPPPDATVQEMLTGPRAPSLVENIKQGDLGIAGLQVLGGLGDLIPFIGPAFSAPLLAAKANRIKFSRGRVPKDAKGHAVPNELLVKGKGEKPTIPVVQKFTPQNKQQVLQNIDEVKAKNPQAMDSPRRWVTMEDKAFGGDFVPSPPLEAINYRQRPELLAEKLDKLTPELKAGVDEGFGYVKDIKNIYNSGLSDPSLTGRLMLWGILSRGAGPVQQESAFLDILDNAKPLIEKASRGDLTDDDLVAWKKSVGQTIPEGSPGKQVTMNANEAGRLLKALNNNVGDETVLNRLHGLMADPNVSGRQFRREFFNLTDSPGIDNKVVSFIGLVGGKDDMLVMDRIQSRHLWNDGRFGDKNIYDGLDFGAGKGGLSAILKGPRGLLLTEALEDGLNDTAKQAYTMVGRPEDASIGRMHWETWVIEGNQAVSHSTLQSVKRGSTIGGSVTEGKPGTFSSGSTYRMTVNGPVVEYPLSDGSVARMTPEVMKDFLSAVKSPKSGILPKGFKVTDAKDKPWYQLPGVQREKLDELARQFENAKPDGSLRSGAKRTQQSGDTVSERRGDFLRAIRSERATGRVSGRADEIDYGGQSGPYIREVRSTNEGVRLLGLEPNPKVVEEYQYAGLNSPRISQIESSANAENYNQAMRASLATEPTAPQVEIKSPQELANMRLFQTESGSGFAIKNDGDIVAVYASPNEPPRGSYSMLEAAVEAGGRKLDAFNTYLPKIYETVGFRPVAKLPWNDEFSPPGWDKKVFDEYNKGEPDVVFFVYDPDYVGQGGAAKLKYSDSYDEAVAVQDKEMARIKPRVDEVLEGIKPQGMAAGGRADSDLVKGIMAIQNKANGGVVDDMEAGVMALNKKDFARGGDKVISKMLGISDVELEWAESQRDRYPEEEAVHGKGDAAAHLALGYITQDSPLQQLGISAREIGKDRRESRMDRFNNRLGSQIQADNFADAERQIDRLIDSGAAQYIDITQPMPDPEAMGIMSIK